MRITAHLPLATILVFAFAVTPPAAQGQRLYDRFDPAAGTIALTPMLPIPLPDSAERRSTGRLIAGGVLGGVIGGALLGFGAASLSCGQRRDDYCGLAAIPGAFLGEALGVPLGVHLSNGARGNLVLEMLASLLIGAGGTALVFSLGAGEGWIMVPVAQLAGVIAIERRTE